jgi:hypothetical protein
LVLAVVVVLLLLVLTELALVAGMVVMERLRLFLVRL